eukprot:CAMPEP_0171306202 /NCGR_PEP_ID=MMETSP0816-20121228/16161_1 /TAXON_ID=420281 /ORGANISM="Proboscia inermis, Strain CCAP1064/1" /LENGTH=456 /DNA_ID=CAMNT_0011787623 /DNA_START=832 /DNA_END=2202 /DNA_ORIENTATION=+
MEEVMNQPVVLAVSRHSKYDPRVPSTIDPLSSCMRIKLVCALLDTSGPSLVLQSKLQRFLTCFQRYLFTRNSIPAEVEFAILDTFDALESQLKETRKKEGSEKSSKTSSDRAGAGKEGFVRFNSWLDAHRATVEDEEEEALAEARAKERLLAQCGVVDMTPDIVEALDEIASDDELVDDAMSDSDDGHEDSISGSEEDSDSDVTELDEMSDSTTTDSEDDHDDVSMSDGSEDDDSGASEEEIDDEEELDEAAIQEAYIRQLEQEAFERELRKLTMDALEKGKVAARTGTGGKLADTMVHATHFVVKKGIDNTSDVFEETLTGNSVLGGGEGVNMKLLKRGHKGRVEAKQLVVPVETNLAKQASKQDDEAAREKDMLKARVLQYEAESSEQYSANLYIDQAKLQVIRNRPLSMEDIDRNFGSSSREHGGDRNRSTQGGRGGGREGGRGRGGRTLRMW